MREKDYFVSDVHLSAERPERSDRFLRFLREARADAGRIFLLGDIFDLWVGPKQTGLPYVVPILAALRALTAEGIEVHYMAGNRDFNFDARMNGGPPPRRLPETLSITSCGLRILLTHGDLLCTNDRAYRRARFIGRSVPVRFALSGMPLGLATFLSRGYRRLSARAVARKSRWEKAIDFARVRAYLVAGHDVVVCGHVHRAARYDVDLAGERTGEFITLGDWEGAGIYLACRNGRLRLRKFS